VQGVRGRLLCEQGAGARTASDASNAGSALLSLPLARGCDRQAPRDTSRASARGSSGRRTQTSPAASTAGLVCIRRVSPRAHTISHAKKRAMFTSAHCRCLHPQCRIRTQLFMYTHTHTLACTLLLVPLVDLHTVDPHLLDEDKDGQKKGSEQVCKTGVQICCPFPLPRHKVNTRG
jgi:hypothetical protein